MPDYGSPDRGAVDVVVGTGDDTDIRLSSIHFFDLLHLRRITIISLLSTPLTQN